MKPILKICAFFLLMLGSLFAQVTPVEIDSATVGRAFARDLWGHYSIRGDFDVDNDGNWRNISGRMDLRGRITLLYIDGTKIVDDKDAPLPGLPYVLKGTITNFWLSVDAMKGDNQVAWGYAHAERLLEGQSLIVSLYPQEERGFVEYEDSGSADRPLLVDGQGLGIGYYNTDLDGFFYYIDPVRGPVTAYVIVDNRRVASFLLDPFSSAKIEDTNLVNVELFGGVVRVMMNDLGYSNYTTTTDGQTKVEGVNVPAKVFITDTEGEYQHLDISVEGGLNIAASVYDISHNGLKLIGNVTFRNTGWENNYYGEYQIPEGCGKIMVVVTSTSAKSQSFRSFFSRGKGGRG